MENVNAPGGWFEAPILRDCTCKGYVNSAGQEGCCGHCDDSQVCEHPFGFYKNQWDQIQDSHFPECPMSIAAEQKRISTLCMCDQLAKAAAEVEYEMEAEDRYFEKGS